MKRVIKKLYEKDFESVFGVRFLPTLELQAAELKKHDITTDREYAVNPLLNQKLEKKFGHFIDQGYAIPMHIRWINKTVQYGVFTEIDLQPGDMVSEYTGILCRDEADEENGYIWDYPTVIYQTIPGKKRRKKIKYCVDALRAGNFARFINHTQRKYQNVGIQIVPRNNMWHVIYVAQKVIKKGQQLLTYYGTQYWRDRQIVPHSLKP